MARRTPRRYQATDPRGWSVKNREGKTVETGFSSYREAALACRTVDPGILFPISN